MEVTPAIQHHYRSSRTVKIPTEHVLPDRWNDRENKPLYKKNSELWKTYRRLSSSQVNAIGCKRILCNTEKSTIDYPGKDGMKCMCYEKLMNIITDSTYIPPPVIYRIPSRKPPRVTLDSVRPTWMKKAMEHYRRNEQLQYPLATLSVRWQQKRGLLHYELATLRSLFGRFGDVVDVRVMTTNSCIVIFRELGPACQVMQAKCLGDPLNPLHCSWWHKSMANKSVVARAKGISVMTDVFVV
ncbi:hypothetical protein ACF0H5_004730 [Mactra antiquata]